MFGSSPNQKSPPASAAKLACACNPRFQASDTNELPSIASSSHRTTGNELAIALHHIAWNKAMSSRAHKRPEPCGEENCGSRRFHVGDDGYTYCDQGHQQSHVSAIRKSKYIIAILPGTFILLSAIHIAEQTRSAAQLLRKILASSSRLVASQSGVALTQSLLFEAVHEGSRARKPSKTISSPCNSS